MFYEVNNFQRNYDCTNIRFIEVLDGKSKPTMDSSECDESRIREVNADVVYSEGPFRYYGYL